MAETFINLPPKITEAIASILRQDMQAKWVTRAETLHYRYMEQEKGKKDRYIHDFTDVLAYLSLRVPATYAQIYSALEQVKEVTANWHPTSVLDIGSGPGTGIWAANGVWPTITDATAVDQDKYFLSVGREIIEIAALDMSVTWQQKDLTEKLTKSTKMYDLVILGNVLNELDQAERENLLEEAYARCRGVMLILEPGTPHGYSIVQAATKKFMATATLIAPYVQNTFVHSNTYYIHFPQRFIRPEFQRRIRQHMRISSLMASDWEEAKYSYVALDKVTPKTTIWARVVGPMRKHKGFLEVPLLTKEGIQHVRVMKRYKEEYNAVKELKWGSAIIDSALFHNSLSFEKSKSLAA